MNVHLERELVELRKLILSEGTLVEDAIAKALDALMTRDHKLAEQVIRTDAEIDQMEIRVEEECLKALALHQPVANDLRFIVAVLKMNNDLERMGDHAANLGKRAAWLALRDPLPWPDSVEQMGRSVKSMVRLSLDALITANAEVARQVCIQDDEVDGLKRLIIREFRGRLRAQPEAFEIMLKMIDVPRQLERIADLATNICEDIVYMLEGNIIRHRHYLEEETSQ